MKMKTNNNEIKDMDRNQEIVMRILRLMECAGSQIAVEINFHGIGSIDIKLDSE